MSTRDVLPEACTTVAGVARAASDADLSVRTPCRDWDLRKLITHLAGTTSGFARLGRGEALDPDDPWGSKAGVAGDDWVTELARNLEAIAGGWSRPERWAGSADAGSQEMPRQALGDMALVEVTLHGWDLARATGRQLAVSDRLGREVLRCVAETAEQGRQYEVYGPEVTVPGRASDFDKALGLAGRDPNWTA